MRSFLTLLHERLAEPAPPSQVLLGPRQVGKTSVILRIFESWLGQKHFVSADDTLQASQIWLTEQWQMASSLGEGSLLVIDEVFPDNH